MSLSRTRLFHQDLGLDKTGWIGDIVGDPRNHGPHGRELIGLDKLLRSYLIVTRKLLIGGFQGLTFEELIVELLVGRKKLLAFASRSSIALENFWQ